MTIQQTDPPSPRDAWSNAPLNKIEPKEFEVYDGDRINCPQCGGNHIRHYCVEVYERGHVVSNAGLAVRIETAMCDERPTVRTSSAMMNNPSRDDNGLRVRFFCEDCYSDMWLRLYWHKGMTYIDWDVIPWELTQGEKNPDRSLPERGAQ